MHRIRIIAVGNHKERWVAESCAHFEKLLQRYAEIEWVAVRTVKGNRSLSPEVVRKRESERILDRFRKGVHVALADGGTRVTSVMLARKLERWLDQGAGRVSFLIGGIYGLHEEVLHRADYTLSLSPLTYSHQLVRPVLLEQLYRCFSIRHGTQYHK